MKRRFSIPTQIIIGLIVIGLIGSIVRSPSHYLIPLLIFAAIFILYKYPPNRLIRTRKGSSKTTYTYQNKTSVKKKPSPFRVIQGNKDSSDDTPKYH